MNKPIVEVKVKQSRRKIPFSRKNGNWFKSKADIILALDEFDKK